MNGQWGPLALQWGQWLSARAFWDGSLVVSLTGSLAHALSPHLGSENPLRHPLSKAYPAPLPQAGAVLDSAPSHCPSLNPENEQNGQHLYSLGQARPQGILFCLERYTPSPRNQPSEVISINGKTCREYLYLLTLKRTNFQIFKATKPE